MKKITVIIIIIIFVIVAGIVLFPKKGYELNPSEAVSYTSLRVAISQSDSDGGGSLSKDDFKTLGELVKKIKGVWFAKARVVYYGKNIDTSESEVTTISDGEYTATFVVKYSEDEYNNYKLLEYNFEKGLEKGYEFIVH